VASSGGGLIRDVAASESKVFWEAWGVKETCVERVCRRYGMAGLGSEDTGGVALDPG